MNTTKVSGELSAAEALEALKRRILVDGFEIVVDPQASHDSCMYDEATGREYLDFYSFFASMPLSFNHPRLREPEYQARLLNAAATKVANSDVYTRYYGEFVQTLDEIAAPEGFVHFFFIDGGALAIENAMKAAFDWKMRKNLEAGRGEIGQQIVHFRQAFHGRTGYTLSVTNTFDPRKTMYFPKFDWPRIDNPKIDFTLAEPRRTEDVAAREQQAVEQIEAAVRERGHDLAALIIEPIQGEGGDNHFRPEFFQRLRELCDAHEMLLIFDEVQTGVGITGTMWACEQMGVLPDILCFGKKMQTCGIMANTRIDDVENVFHVSSRINSTWGGNLADMVRATQVLRIIESDRLLDSVAQRGRQLLEGLKRLAEKHEIVQAVRGRGVMCAFDLPDTQTRDRVRAACFERRMLLLHCGQKTIRFRPVLDVGTDAIDRGLEIMDEALTAVAQDQD